jgi:hypothetical protein
MKQRQRRACAYHHKLQQHKVVRGGTAVGVEIQPSGKEECTKGHPSKGRRVNVPKGHVQEERGGVLEEKAAVEVATWADVVRDQGAQEKRGAVQERDVQEEKDVVEELRAELQELRGIVATLRAEVLAKEEVRVRGAREIEERQEAFKHELEGVQAAGKREAKARHRAASMAAERQLGPHILVQQAEMAAYKARVEGEMAALKYALRTMRLEQASGPAWVRGLKEATRSDMDTALNVFAVAMSTSELQLRKLAAASELQVLKLGEQVREMGGNLESCWEMLTGPGGAHQRVTCIAEKLGDLQQSSHAFEEHVVRQHREIHRDVNSLWGLFREQDDAREQVRGLEEAVAVQTLRLEQVQDWIEGVHACGGALGAARGHAEQLRSTMQKLQLEVQDGIEGMRSCGGALGAARGYAEERHSAIEAEREAEKTRVRKLEEQVKSLGEARGEMLELCLSRVASSSDLERVLEQSESRAQFQLQQVKHEMTELRSSLEVRSQELRALVLHCLRT